jgi:CheY-like chemotaxis protein
MSGNVKRHTIVMADDDAEDRLLLTDAVARGGLPHRVHTVPDGEALLEFLAGRVAGFGEGPPPRPDLILLDLNMPRKDGRETLRALKQDQRLQRIPIVVLTTSTRDEDIHFAYRFGASSYIAKPATFQGWIDMVHSLDRYWFQLVRLPCWE